MCEKGHILKINAVSYLDAAYFFAGYIKLKESSGRGLRRWQNILFAPKTEKPLTKLQFKYIIIVNKTLKGV